MFGFKKKRELENEIERLKIQISIGARDKKLSEKQKKEALALLITEPLNAYLLAWLDELMRQGVYLKQEYTTDNVRFLADQVIELMTKARRLENEGLKDNRRRTR